MDAQSTIPCSGSPEATRPNSKSAERLHVHPELKRLALFQKGQTLKRFE